MGLTALVRRGGPGGVVVFDARPTQGTTGSAAHFARPPGGPAVVRAPAFRAGPGAQRCYLLAAGHDRLCARRPGGVAAGGLHGHLSPESRLFSPSVPGGAYVPIVVFIPLSMMWFGTGEAQKVGFLFIGCFVALLPLVIKDIADVPTAFLDVAVTKGASQWQLVRHVLFPWPRGISGTTCAGCMAWGGDGLSWPRWSIRPEYGLAVSSRPRNGAARPSPDLRGDHRHRADRCRLRPVMAHRGGIPVPLPERPNEPWRKPAPEEILKPRKPERPT